MAETTLGASLGTDMSLTPYMGSSKEAKAYSEKAAPLLKQQVEGEAELKKEEMLQQGRGFEAKAKAERGYQNIAKDLNKEAENKELAYPRPEFHPTKENAQSLGELFSMVATMGLMLGGSGKMAAQGALDAMGGMLKGWQSGRKDLYERQLKEYDKEYKRMQDIRTDIQNHLQKGMQLAAIDKDASYAEYQQAAAISGASSIGASYLKAGVPEKALDLMNKTYTIDKDIADRNERKAEHQAKLAQAERHHQETMASQKAKSLLKSGDQASFINEQTGANLSPKDAQEVSLAALSVGHAYLLLGKVQEHPEWIGRSGQIKQFFNRYVDSLNNNKPLPEDDPSLASDKSGQEALVFAKDYAAYLVNYERSIAGGARGFTVQFQKRFNDLLNQNQFNASGFNNLMNQQIDEISRTAIAKSPEKLNKNNITKMGMIIYGDDPYALKAYQGIQKNTSDQKVASKLDVEETAKANNITVEEAKKRLKAKNFKIEGE
jgi:hypothetical protein